MFLHEKVKEINKNLEILKSVENIAVWGAGLHTVKLFEKTSLLSYKVKTILDMDERKQGEAFFGYVIENPRKINWKKIDAVVISVPNREQNITNMLRGELQYSGDIVVLYANKESTPFYLLYDEKIHSVRYIGEYSTWEEAAEECAGYDDNAIISKVIDAIEKVRRGEAVWERDSCLFYEAKYVYRVCAAILRCAVQNRRVRLLDIGGSLGSTWFQNREYLTDVENLEYIVAEQDHFVEYGHKNLEDGTLKFISSLEPWERMERFDVILMSGSLQYIPQYEEVINRIKVAKPRYIVIDRFLVSDRKRICIETVPEEIYFSSYPVVIFSKDEVPNLFGGDYSLIEDDQSSVPEQAYFTDGKAESRFYVYKCTV